MPLVYEHWRPDTNECFYVGVSIVLNGAGALKRANSFVRQNQYYMNIVNKLKIAGLRPIVKIVDYYVLPESAKCREKMQIAFRRALLKDKLTNVTEGGDGTVGYKYSPEQIKKYKKRFSGKGNPNFGKHWDDEHRKILSQKSSGENNHWFGKKRPEHSIKMQGKNNPKSVAVIELDSGKSFLCRKDAAEYYGISAIGISKTCTKVQKSVGGYRFAYVNSVEGQAALSRNKGKK